MTTRTGKRSTYNLDMAFGYLRLAYQSMSRDQDAAQRMIKTIVDSDGNVTVTDRLLALAHVIVWKLDAEEKDRKK